MARVLLEQFDDLKFFGGVFVDIEERYRNADYTETLEGFLPKLAADHKSYFKNAQDAEGRKWAALKPSTIRRKGHDTILIDKGDLLDSLQGQHANAIREVTHRGLHFGTRDEKAGYHQDGTSRMPARPPVGLTEERLDELVGAVADSLVDQLRHTL